MFRKTFLFFITVLVISGCTRSEIPLDQSIGEEPTIVTEEDFSREAEKKTIPPKTSVTDTSRTVERNSPIKKNPLELLVSAQQCEKDHYVIGPEDVINTIVTGQNEYKLVREHTVGIDGTIIFDFIGEVMASGLTVNDLELLLKKTLADDFLVNPKVSISIKEYKSHKVYISGDVNRGGELILKKQCQWLSEVIMEAGGLKGNFNKDAFVVSGKGAENPQVKVVDLYHIFIDGNKENDVLVFDNDIIKIFDKGNNPLGPQNSIFIFGEVNKPGMYPFSDDLTVLSAILIHAGGFTKASKKSKCVVKREENDEIQSLTIDLNKVMQGEKEENISLRPGDIIRIPRTFF